MFFGTWLEYKWAGQKQRSILRSNFRLKGADSKYRNNMKTISKNNFSALLALMLGVLVLTSAKSSETMLPTDPEPIVEDLSYMDEIEEYVEAYFTDFVQEESLLTDYVKVFNSNDELVVEGERSSLSKEELQKLHQANLLTENRGVAYYQMNN